MFFSGWAELLRVVVVGFLAYVAIVMLLRVTGKRALVNMNAYDLIVTVALGSTLATALLSSEVKLDKAIIAFALLLGLQRLVAWLSMKFRWFHDLVNAEPSLVLHRGRMLDEALRRRHLTPDEVRAAVRAQGYASLEEIEAVVMEESGTLSVIPRVDRGSRSALSNIRDESS